MLKWWLCKKSWVFSWNSKNKWIIVRLSLKKASSPFFFRSFAIMIVTLVKKTNYASSFLGFWPHFSWLAEWLGASICTSLMMPYLLWRTQCYKFNFKIETNNFGQLFSKREREKEDLLIIEGEIYTTKYKLYLILFLKMFYEVNYKDIFSEINISLLFIRVHFYKEGS